MRAFDGSTDGTVASHAARWRSFCQRARERGVRDVRQLTASELAQFPGAPGATDGAGPEHPLAKHRLASENVVLESLRGDRALWVKPGACLGHRPRGCSLRSPTGAGDWACGVGATTKPLSQNAGFPRAASEKALVSAGRQTTKRSQDP